ncbi:MAG: photosystem II S4 domain protein [Prochlorococcaceae cyanobacterium]
MLPRRDLLGRSRRPEALEPLIAAAETALRTWEPVWSPFLAPELLEEASRLLGDLMELSLTSVGGHPAAERRRMLLQRADAALDPLDLDPGLAGLEISGNFLFDPAETGEMRRALTDLGAADGDLGDLWLRGERGAQAIGTAALAQRLDGANGQVRSVAVTLLARPLDALQPPAARSAKRLSTVEASLRLDAVASAGFGLSRSRMAELIRSGAVRLNWQPVLSPSRELAPGDRVRLEGRGELAVLTVAVTRRDRFRLELERR